MKKIIILSLIYAALFTACAPSSEEPVLYSPDGRIQLSVKTIDGNLYYSVAQDGEQLFSDSRLGFVLMGANYLNKNNEILSVTHSKFKETWETVWGQSREVLDEHNTMLIHTAHLDL